MARKSNTQEETIQSNGDTDTDDEVEESSPITPSDIADAVGADPKAVRSYLRSNFGRDASMKGKSWNIPEGVAAKVIEHFSASEDEESEESDEG